MLGILVTFVPSNGFTEGLEMSHMTITSQASSVWVLRQVPPAVPEVSSAREEIRDRQSSVNSQHSHSQTNLLILIPLISKGSSSES